MPYKRRTRFAAFAVCLLFCLAMALSVSFLLTAHDHACSGDGCPVCAALQACKTRLRAAAAACGGLAVCLRCCAAHPYSMGSAAAACAPSTPVSLKVKLLD